MAGVDDPNGMDDITEPDPNKDELVLLAEAAELALNRLGVGAPDPNKAVEPVAGDPKFVEVPNGDGEGEGDEVVAPKALDVMPVPEADDPKKLEVPEDDPKRLVAVLDPDPIWLGVEAAPNEEDPRKFKVVDAPEDDDPNGLDVGAAAEETVPKGLEPKGAAAVDVVAADEEEEPKKEEPPNGEEELAGVVPEPKPKEGADEAEAAELGLPKPKEKGEEDDEEAPENPKPVPAMSAGNGRFLMVQPSNLRSATERGFSMGGREF